MSGDPKAQRPDVKREYVRVCWCSPGSVFDAYLWGTLLILLGGAWLLDSLNVVSENFLDLFWPLVVIGLGSAYLGRAIIRRTEGWFLG